MARPKYLEARRASLRAMAPGLVGFHGLAFLRGGSEDANATGPREHPNSSGTAGGDRFMAFARIVGAIGRHGSDLFVCRDLV